MSQPNIFYARSCYKASLDECLLLLCWKYYRKHENMLAFSIISQQWGGINTTVEMLPLKYEVWFILHIQYHDCWWPGDARSQGISSLGIDLVIPEYSDFSTTRISYVNNWKVDMTQTISLCGINFPIPWNDTGGKSLNKTRNFDKNSHSYLYIKNYIYDGQKPGETITEWAINISNIIADNKKPNRMGQVAAW